MDKAKRDAIRARLAQIETKHKGRLTPDAVVDDAKDKKSPLHDQFEWDDSKAAAAHRLAQARRLIVSVLVTTTTTTTIVEAPYYVRDPNAASNEQGYVSVPTLRSDQDYARAALIDAFKSAGDMLRRARELAIVLEMHEEVDTLINGVLDLRQRVEQPEAVM